MAAGNKHLEYKEVLNTMEVNSPGSKHAFYFGFLERAAALFTGDSDEVSLVPCERCGSPTTGEVCAFCRLVERVAVDTSQPVELGKAPVKERT